MENLNTKGIPDNRPSENELFSKVRIPWKKSKEDAWKEVSDRIITTKNQGAIPRQIYFASWAIAASLLILLSGSLFIGFYKRSYSAGPDEQKTMTFTDGSTVMLNAESEISYRPFWYAVSRKIKLKGEAFFHVKPGRKFFVLSAQGATTVLGTRFNIFARNNQYEVSCLSGKVKVESRLTEDAVILQHDEKASLNDNGKLDLQILSNLEQLIPWIQSEWEFTNEPLSNIISIIEHHYNASISLPPDEPRFFTGEFSKSMSVEIVLDLVCTPFGYTFTKKPEGGYEIQFK